MENVRTFASAFEKKAPVEKQVWSGSSVWLEYMPVTHGVASSSLVRTAKQKEGSLTQRTFFILTPKGFNPQTLTFNRCMGLLGFDSKDNGFVSMQADAPEALTTDAKQ